MSITATNLTTSGNNVDATSFATASIAPPASNLILAWVTTKAATAPTTPTASGNSLTWVEVGHIDTNGDGTGTQKTTLFRALGSSPSTGALTFDFASQTQTGACWTVVSFANMDTSGTNGSGAIVQAVTNFTASTVTTLTVTLAAFSNVNNATAGGFGIPLNTASQPTAGAAFTRIGQFNNSSPNLSIGSEFSAGNNTSVDMNCAAATVPWTGIAVEIKIQDTAGFSIALV